MKGYKHLTPDQIDRLPDLYREHLTVAATAEALGATQAQVRRNLKGMGVPLNFAKPTSTCYQHIDLIRELAAQGLSFSEIGRRIGVKNSTVSAFLRRHDIPHTPWDRSAPENNHWWRGGRIVDKDGYVLLKRQDHPRADRHGYVREHRLVMEEVLGRYLTAEEVVHHRDGDKENNTPANLEVFQTNAQHLATTLIGNVPQWTPEGRQRIREAVLAANQRRRSNRAA